MPRRMWFTIAPVLLIWIAEPARGDLMVSIGSATVAQGGLATVDVYLTSDAKVKTPDEIDNFGIQLRITNNGTDNTQLAFSNSQDFRYVNNNSSYVFFGDSSVAQSSPAFGGSAGETVYPNGTFTGADSTFSGNPVGFYSGTTYLLASLTLTTTMTGSAPMAGDSFTISLVQSSGNGSMFGTAAEPTYFDNFDFNNTGTELSATPFTSSSGTVTITNASAVPEPASIVPGLTGLGILAGIWVARRLRRASSSWFLVLSSQLNT